MAAVGRRQPSVVESELRSAGVGRMTRILSGTFSRAAARPVGLNVSNLQAAAIEEEWTAAGTLRYDTAVTSKTWKKTEHLRSAVAPARGLDVARDSRLALCEEPFAEVLLRELAAVWYLDRYPADTDTADFLRETAVGNFGMPKVLWVEARDHRRLTRRTSPADSSKV